MPTGKINNVDEIANGSAVRCVPICTKNVQDRLGACKDSGNDWDQVARLLSRIFAKDTRLVASNLVSMLVQLNLSRYIKHLQG
jgi:hypothetical protein